MKRFYLAAALAASALTATAASAATPLNLTGATVKATLFSPDKNTIYAGPFSSIVGGGVEFGPGTFAPASGSFDITSNGFTYSANQTGTYSTSSFNGYRLTFDNFTGDLHDLLLTMGGAITPTSIDISADGRSVLLNLSGVSVTNGDTFTAAVPEPATWAMMLVGFGMMGASMRYRRKATAVSFA